jgi:ABC-type antimicrobial peptide transport system permease subunit
VSYSVALRRKEIGIRLALGALDRSILWLMARQMLWPVGLATVTGAIGGVALGIFMSSEEMLLAPEMPVIAATLIVLLTMIGLSCIIPTLRALRRSDTRVLYA